VNNTAKCGAKLLEEFNNKITKNEEQKPHLYSNSAFYWFIEKSMYYTRIPIIFIIMFTDSTILPS